MNSLPSLFLNDTIVTEIETFCASDPEFMRTKQEFYKIQIKSKRWRALTCTTHLKKVYGPICTVPPTSIISMDWVFVKTFCGR